jgi:hypothetical protein
MAFGAIAVRTLRAGAAAIASLRALPVGLGMGLADLTLSRWKTNIC